MKETNNTAVESFFEDASGAIGDLDIPDDLLNYTMEREVESVHNGDIPRGYNILSEETTVTFMDGQTLWRVTKIE